MHLRKWTKTEKEKLFNLSNINLRKRPQTGFQLWILQNNQKTWNHASIQPSHKLTISWSATPRCPPVWPAYHNRTPPETEPWRSSQQTRYPMLFHRKSTGLSVFDSSKNRRLRRKIKNRTFVTNFCRYGGEYKKCITVAFKIRLVGPAAASGAVWEAAGLPTLARIFRWIIWKFRVSKKYLSKLRCKIRFIFPAYYLDVWLPRVCFWCGVCGT